MASSIDEAVLDALCGHLTSPALSGGPPIALPFVTYTPTPGTAYVDARPVLRAEPRVLGLAFDSSIERRGVFQVDAVVPNAAGETPGLRLAALIAARFAIGTKLVATVGSTRHLLRLNSEPTIAAAVTDAPWVRFPVSIPYLVIK